MFKNTKNILFVMMIFVLALTAGCEQPDMPKQPGSDTQVGAVDQNKTQNADEPDKKQEMVKVYFANEDGTKLVAKAKQAEKSAPDKYSAAIAALLAGTQDSGAIVVIPAKTKLRGIVVQKNVAYVDFSSDLVKRFNGGSTGEIMLVGSIVNTLTEFPEIKAVQILVDGKKIETIAGHYDLSEPITRVEDILKN